MTESTSVALARVEQERDRFVAAADKLHDEWLDLKADLARVEQERDEATRLLEYAFHLRQHGERAPGGNETWAQFDRDTESHLRRREVEL